jgi:drug/metabolite transporter (DMT)-like permease
MTVVGPVAHFGWCTFLTCGKQRFQQPGIPMSQTANRSMDLATWSLLLLLGFIWGGSFFFGRIAVQHVPPMTLVLFRVALAAIALHLVFGRLPGFYQTLLSRWRELLVMGLINNAIPFTLIFLGQTEIGSGLASILNATTPLWAVLVAQVFTTDEKITAAKLIGCALGLAGMVMLIGPAALGIADSPLWAKLAVVGAAISYGFAASFGKRFKGISPRVTATGQLTASTLIMLPMAFIVDRALDAAGAARRRHCRHSGAGIGLHRLRLSRLLPDPQRGRRHLRLAGHASCASRRHPAGHPVSGRDPLTHRDAGPRPDCTRALVTGQPAGHKTGRIGRTALSGLRGAGWTQTA